MKVLYSDKFKLTNLKTLLKRGKADLSDAFITIRKIIDDVKKDGDKALVKCTEKFDKIKLDQEKIRITENEIKQSYDKLERKQIKALKKASENIKKFHTKQLRTQWSIQIKKGITAGQIIRPLDSIGIYVPGGKATYPSTVLMCAIPAKIAGVKNIVMCTPPGENGVINPTLLVAADLAGVDEVYRVGGAQAIAAMAYGTKTVRSIDKIVGPGNIYVTAAKIEVSKNVAIDIPAGPSEVLIIADKTANASYIAFDLLAQSEHDPKAWAILLTPSETLANEVNKIIEKQMDSCSRKEIIKSSIEKGGLIVIVKNIDEAIELSNMIAPEHLQIQTKRSNKILSEIKNAGAIFLGSYTPVSFGDYSSGLNHVLPTAGYAKIYSGLSCQDFVKTMNFLECEKEGFENLKETTITFAKMEGFDAHSKAVSIREGKE